tara:strand:- start:4291 stop:5475 length:1185 start_codon:yes stop_codon:yes gene_type:complete
MESSKHKTLPSWTYNNEVFFELEKRDLFLNNWQLICHGSNIPLPGDYFTFDLFNERLVAVRDASLEIRVFHNVCSHRATKLLDRVSGNCGKRIVCPYHAWSYDLSGNLKHVPGLENFENLDLKDHGLRIVEQEVFKGFVFAKVLQSDVPSVREQFEPYLAEIEPYRFEDLEPLGRVTLRPREVNWKQIADNYVDAMHISVAHPGLSNLVGASYDLEVSCNGGFVHRMSADLNASRKNMLSNVLYKKLLPRVDHLPTERQWQWTYYRLWPNLAFDVYPDQMDFMQFIPINASTTMIREIPFALKDDRREMKVARYLNWRINREVNAEDTRLIKRVQEGMRTSAFQSGPLAKSEICLIDSAEKIRQAIPIATLDQEPATEDMQALNRELSSRMDRI